MHATPHPTVSRLRPVLLAIALALSVPAASVHAQATAASPDVTTPVPFTIVAQPLPQALAAWSAQARVPVSVRAELTAGKAAPAVSGTLSPLQALQQLLAGTDLVAQADGAAVVVRQSSPAATLPAVSVRAKVSADSTPLGYLSKKTVTGALGDKAVLDTPFSVSVVSSEQMVERGAKSISQIFFNDASVYSPTPSSTTDWWGTQIRGLGVRNMYVDDVPMMLYWGGEFATEVVESVTALKGLTGFMYGFGEPGGALSYKLKRPTGANETTVSVGYGNPGLFGAHVDTTRILGEELALRANLATTQGKAFNGAKIDRTVASLALDKQFGASLKWFSTLVYEDSRNKGEPMQFYVSAYDMAGSGGKLPTVRYDYDKINIDNSYYNAKTTLASTGVDWRINDRWTLNGQIGVSRKEHHSNKSFADLLNVNGDYDGNMYNFGSQLDSIFTQAMVTGNVSLLGMKHEVVGGVGTQRSKGRSGNYNWVNDFSGNLYVTQPFVITRAPDFALKPTDSDVAQQYAFISDTVHVTDNLQLIGGLRYTHYDMEDFDGDPAVDGGYSINKASPTLALIYKPDMRTSLYASYVQGLEPGSRVSDPKFVNQGEILGATVSKQAEIGVKHQSDNVEYTAALFRIERAKQLEVDRGGALFLTQDGIDEYTGVELAAAWQATRNLNVGAGTVYLDGVIKEVEDLSLVGNTAANAGRWQAVVHAQYKVPSITGLKLHGAARYFGSTYADNENLIKVPGRTLVNAGFSQEFKAQGMAWTLYGNVNNLFNEKYWSSGGWGSANIGEARNATISLKTQF